MLGSQVVILITIAVYLIAMVLIGVYFGKKGSGNSSDDFYLGGRKMGPLVTAMSAEASDMSSYLLMGLPDWHTCAACRRFPGPASVWR